ncbi:MAG: endopeptidase La [Candidatus Glassbacteria bacterium]|nr:endopeptidase La [Candidatus Glassbacteria bacterium]
MKPSTEIKQTANTKDNLPDSLPLLPLTDRVVFPNVVVPVMVPEGSFAQLVENNISDRQLVALGFPGNNAGRADGDRPENPFLPVGTLGRVLKMMRMQDDSIRLLIQGVRRIRLKDIRSEGVIYYCSPTEIRFSPEPQVQLAALRKALLLLFYEMIDLNPNLSEDLREASDIIALAGDLADFVSANIELPLQEKRQVFLTLNPRDRAQMVIDLLVRERNLIELSRQIQTKVKSQLDKEQREYYLREQLRVIRLELGEDDPHKRELDQLSEEIEGAEMSEEALEMARRELDRLRRIPPSASEYHVSRTWLDWLINLPWQTFGRERIDINEARRILDEDHYSLNEVKERIIEFLAVRQLKPDSKGPIICFTGPPGVGKTSLGKSVARALGRKFCRIALGGIRDEAEIRGHRRTYIGSMPGWLIQVIRRAGVNNPVVMLDEIDKLGTDRGDPASALLEVLDPAQNSQFSDHYLEVNFDLSNVFFIATANLQHQIPHALRDRLEIIEISGYTPAEKWRIAERHLIPRQLEENGLAGENMLKLPEKTVLKVIGSYTRESGVRELERCLATLCRKTALTLLEGGFHSKILPQELNSFLGVPKFLPETAGRSPEVGTATALAWTAYGGEILFVEALKMDGGKNFDLTGQLGEVMRESALAAFSYLRANQHSMGIDPETFAACDVHLHVPSGATPKDGPSAGVAILASLASLLGGVPVRHDVAMTGEITLRGKVLPVGGVKEKVLAAHRAGIKKVILPADNEKDLSDLPVEVSRELTFSLVDDVRQALEIALERDEE